MRSHTRFAAAIPLAAFALLAPRAAAAQPDVVSITRRASPAVVTLHNLNAAGQRASLGSGFFLPDGRIVTNRHVVEGASRITVTSADERQIGSAEYAEAVGTNADLAILPRVANPPASIPVATRMPEPGEAVVVIGAPEGLSNTVSTGIVSAIRRIRGRTLVQITAPISHGSSGGPVMNMRGEVIGVSVSVLSEGQNLNFAVPASELTALQQARPQRLAFTGNLRSNVGAPGDRPTGPDITTLPIPRLPRITVGQTVSGRLANTDFVRPDGSYADTYVYSARAGERVTVTLRSRDFDSWVVVSDRTGNMNEFDDDSGGGLDSELTVTFPRDGQYLIVANSVAADATGAYQMSLRSAGRGEVDPGGGGRGTIEDLARRTTARITAGQTVNGRLSSGDFIRSEDNTYADGYLYAGRRGERLTITMRSTAFDSYLVFDEPTGPLREVDDDSGGGNDAQVNVTLPRDGNYLIVANAYARGGAGAYTLSVTSGRGGGVDDGGTRPQPGGRGTLADLARQNLPRIAVGQTVNGRLSSGDFVRSDDDTFADGYAFEGRRGERITITMRASGFDAWVVFDDPNGPMREHDDDSGGGNDAQLTVTLPHDGRFLIVANAVAAGSTGAYTLSVQRGGGGGGEVPPPDEDDHDHGDSGGGSEVFDQLAARPLPRITAGQTVNGRLSENDFLRSDDNTFADGFIYNGRAGERLTITMQAPSFDAWTVIHEVGGEFHQFDDDGGEGTDSRLQVTLPRTGRYLIVANSVARSTGSYTLQVTSGR